MSRFQKMKASRELHFSLYTHMYEKSVRTLSPSPLSRPGLLISGTSFSSGVRSHCIVHRTVQKANRQKFTPVSLLFILIPHRRICSVIYIAQIHTALYRPAPTSKEKIDKAGQADITRIPHNHKNGPIFDIRAVQYPRPRPPTSRKERHTISSLIPSSTTSHAQI
jgi:hypothetical protein